MSATELSATDLSPTDLSTSGAREIVEYTLPPTFETVEEERRHRKERLAAALRVFGRFGFGEGVAGHITARDPELTDHFWVNPFGLSFRRVTVSDLLLVGPDGTVVEGERPVNRAAFVIHAAIHEARPDIVAAAHAHSVHGKAWSSLGRPLDPITQDACVFFEDHVVVADEGGRVVFEKEAGVTLAQQLGTNKAAIHQNHGHFTVGQTVDEAAWWYITMERSAQAQLMAEAAGTPIHIDAEGARYTRDLTGFPLAGWISYQPIWQDIVRSDPDLFD
jgi:ribulose-5-phosphate 4-epimerase/fuculose-1-phosphate aldolase